MSKERINKIEQLLNAFISIKFEDYIALSDFVEMQIQIIQKEDDVKWEKFDKGEADVDFHTYIKENDLNDFSKFYSVFPNRMRCYGIIQTYSMLEHYIKWLCIRLQKIENSKFGLSDLKGNSDIEKGKLFLTKLYQIDFNKLNPEWTFINDMRIIRNQIIHKNGEVLSSDLDVLGIIEKYDELGFMFDEIPKHNILEDSEIEIKSKKLNEDFVKMVKSFFLKIFSEIKKA